MEIKTDFSAYLDKINSILLKALPDTPDQFFIEKAFERSGLNINGINLTSSREVQELLKPNRELLLSGGKRWRPLFLVLCAEAFIEKNRICGQQAEKLHRLESLEIPENFDFDSISGLTIECRQKFKKYSPRTIGQASRISGVSPSDISVLLVYFGR